MDIPHLFIHASANGHLGRFHVFWLLWKMILWIFMNPFFCGYMFSFLLDIYLEVELLGNMVILFNLLGNCQTVFQSGCHILHSHKQHVRVPIFIHPRQHLLFVLLILAILVGMKWYLIVFFACLFVCCFWLCHVACRILVHWPVIEPEPGPWQWKWRVLTTGLPGSSLIVTLICISLMTNDVEHLSIYSLAICISSLEKCLFRSFVNCIMSFYSWVMRDIYILWIVILIRYVIYKIFLPFCGFSFYFLDDALRNTKGFNFDDV